MKVLLTTDTFYPMINGVVISTNNLYEELRKFGHDVRILTLSEDGKERIDGDIYYLKSFNLNIYPGAKIKKPFNTEVSEHLLAWAPDIVHSQTEFSTMINAKYISWKLKVPHIHTYHTMYEEYLAYILKGKVLRPGAMRLLVRLLLNLLDKVIAPTEKVKKSLLDYGVKTDISVIPTGIDLGNFQKSLNPEEATMLRLKYNLHPKDKVILYLGRIAQEKNIDEIINIYEKIQREFSDIKLLIVGKGPYLDTLKAFAEEKNLNNKVIFTGMVPPREVYKYYKLADVFVTASTSETQGLTYIEALSSGIPVICKYDPCIEGVIEDRKNGLVYTNEDDFIEAIKYIFSDDNYRYELSDYCLSTAHKFSSYTFAKRIEELYKEVISEKRPSSQNHSA